MAIRDLIPWGRNESRSAVPSTRGEEAPPLLTFHREMNRLFDDVFSETGSDYRRLLMYRFHQSKSGFMHMPRRKLIRKDDMPSNFPIDLIAKYDVER